MGNGSLPAHPSGLEILPPKEGRKEEGSKRNGSVYRAFSSVKLLWQWLRGTALQWQWGGRGRLKHCNDSEVGEAGWRVCCSGSCHCFCDITAMSANRFGPVSYQNVQKKKMRWWVLYVHVYLHCFINWMLLSSSDPYLLLPHHEAFDLMSILTCM